MQYYSVIKKNEVMSFAGKWTGIITLSKISQAQRAKYHIFTHVESWRKMMIIVDLIKMWTIWRVRGGKGREVGGEKDRRKVSHLL
jgi:hypothetical protein